MRLFNSDNSSNSTQTPDTAGIADTRDDYFAASAGDCTGLIPSGGNTDEELSNYEEVYPYLPPTPAAPDSADFPDVEVPGTGIPFAPVLPPTLSESDLNPGAAIVTDEVERNMLL